MLNSTQHIQYFLHLENEDFICGTSTHRSSFLVLYDSLARQQHDALVVDVGVAPDVLNGLPIQHLYGHLVSLLDLVHERQEAVRQDDHGRLLPGERLELITVGQLHHALDGPA